MMGMMRVIVDEKLYDAKFIETRCEGFDELRRSLETVSLDEVERITGVPQEKIAQAARLYATRKPGAIFFAMGITQHTHGTDNVLAASNLALLTGNIGKPSSGVNPLRGQNNVQGACDMGALPNVYPGYQRVDDARGAGQVRGGLGRAAERYPGPGDDRVFRRDRPRPDQGPVSGRRESDAQRRRFDPRRASPGATRFLRRARTSS